MVDCSDLIGIPYRIHGRDKEGFDCYGLVLEVERRLGNILPDFDYESYTNRYFNEKVSEVREQKRPLRIHTYFEGAIILFKDSRGMHDHIGVYLEDGNFIHCNRDGVHLEKIRDWEGKVAGVYAWQR